MGKYNRREFVKAGIGASVALPVATTQLPLSTEAAAASSLVQTSGQQQATPALSLRYSVTDLRCEYADDPLGVDRIAPRLFWKLESSERNQFQTAYRIIVASSEALLAQDKGDLWDSGRVASDETVHIPYRGRPLKSSQQVFWKIRSWDKDQQESAWSRTASWTMGLLPGEADWKARWIAARSSSETLRLRREFTIKPGLVRALAHVSGLGHYELTINGRKASEDLFSPGWTKYDKTCLYDTRDVTSLVREGSNAIALLLAGGMYNIKGGRYTKFKGSFGPLKAILQLHLDYADNTTEVIGTDEQWATSPGPIKFSCVFGGEDYDACLDERGWDQSGFDDSTWQAAQLTDGPGGKLKGLTAAAPPIRAFDVLKPVSVKPLMTAAKVYDLGQNASLIPRITVRGSAGAIIKIIPAELLKEDGSVDPRSTRNGPAYWQYTLSGGGSETWFPKFFYHGSRYLQVECSATDKGGDPPVVEALEGVVVHSASAPIGEFECSSDLFNRIHKLVRWAQRSNIMSVITDCPHRERLGWLEQYHLNGSSLRYEFDLAQLFTKGMSDMADSQLDNGLVPDIAPEYTVFEGGFRDSPEWGSAYVIVPWQQYEWTGDLELLRRHYEGMKRYVAYLGTKATDHIVSHGLGDWYDIGPKRPGVAQLTPIALTATAVYYYDARILAQAATLLGKTDDARAYEKLSSEIRAAFNQKFFDATKNQYATGSQTANSIPLVMNLVAPKNRAAVLEAVVRDVRRRGNALTSGDVGYRYLLRALAEGGRSDVIFDMNNQSDKPGYGYQLKMGATSLTEAWNADPRSSQNHFMLGQIMEWFYHDLAGIGGDPTGPGFKKIIIKPEPIGNLAWAKASYDSVRGKITSGWKKDDGVFTLSVAIPPNTTATVFIPASSSDRVTEGGVAAARRADVKFLRQENNRAVYEIQSGQWVFQSRL